MTGSGCGAPGQFCAGWDEREFIPLSAAIFGSSALVLVIIAIRSVTIMGFRLGLLGAIVPAAAILALTLLAAIHTRLQGILITGVGIALFIVAMLLIPRLKLQQAPLPASKESKGRDAEGGDAGPAKPNQNSLG